VLTSDRDYVERYREEMGSKSDLELLCCQSTSIETTNMKSRSNVAEMSLLFAGERLALAAPMTTSALPFGLQPGELG
jgi:hypothetical protein